MNIFFGIILVLICPSLYKDNCRDLLKSDTESGKRWALIGMIGSCAGFVLGVMYIAGVLELPELLMFF